MASIDIKDAYYSVPIAVSDRKFLNFEWYSKIYQFTCFPNINQFSSGKWSKTSLARKKLHTLRNCQICTTFHGPVASLFPESKNFKSKTKSPLTNIVNSTTKAIPINAKPTNAEIREIGNMIYSELDKTCKENIGTSFKDMLIKTPEVNLQEKKESSGEEKR